MAGGSPSGFHFLQEWLSCQRKFYWHYVERLEPKSTSRNLVFGVAIHEALHQYIMAGGAGINAVPALEKAVVAFEESYRAELEKIKEVDMIDEDLESGPILLRAYVNKYWFDHFKALAAEEELFVDIPNGLCTKADRFTGRIDLVTENEGRIEIRDYKTTRANFGMIEKSLRISDQANGYMWLWNRNHPDKPCNTLVYDLMKIYKGKPDFMRIPVMRSDDDILRFERKAAFILNEIATRVSTEDAVFVENTESCNAWNRQCPYYDLCWASASQAVKDSLFTVREEVAGGDSL